MKMLQKLAKVVIKIKALFLNIFHWVFSKDGFLITILVALLANILSSNIQNLIERQRYLELLQLEIRSNYIVSVQYIKSFEDKGVILNFTPYSTSVFESGLQSGYILTVNNEELIELETLYSMYLPKLNLLLSQRQLMIDQYLAKWEECIIEKNGEQFCKKDQLIFENVQKKYSKYMYDLIFDLKEKLYEVKFNPTQERLNSPILMFFIGKERLKIQE